MFAQPIFGFVETRCNKRWPDSKFITSEYSVPIPFLGEWNINLFRMVWRTTYVVITSVIAMILTILQRLLGVDWCCIFLSINRVFPHRNVHCPRKNTQVLLHLGVAKNFELGVFGCISCGSCRFHTRPGYRPQDIQALQKCWGLSEAGLIICSVVVCKCNELVASKDDLKKCLEFCNNTYLVGLFLNAIL